MGERLKEEGKKLVKETYKHEKKERGKTWGKERKKK
jgi:hypothetical protein